jgi:hypothetical protein
MCGKAADRISDNNCTVNNAERTYTKDGLPREFRLAKRRQYVFARK